MGYSSYSDSAYTSRKSEFKAAGKTSFDYNDRVVSKKPAHERVSHEKLNPKGVTFRESRDSDDHPSSNPVAVFFDVTGSMGTIPRLLQEKLPTLMGVLLRKGYLTDPQILFGAVGDGNGDRAPLQVGQFESGIEMDEAFENMWIEGGGGGTREESYDLAMYFMSRHTATDSYEKRGTPGYMFLIGDEYYYPTVRKALVEKFIGDTLQEDIPIEDIAAELCEKWNVFYICIQSNTYPDQTSSKARWSKLFPERVTILDDISLVCETIVATIGANEGIDTIFDDLKEHGISDKDADKIKNALTIPAKSVAVSLPSSGTSGAKTL